MTKKRVYISVIILLFLGGSVLLYYFSAAKTEKNFLQDNIDHQLSYNLQQLNIYLHRTSYDNADADTINYYYKEMAKSSAVCETLFSISSYADDAALHSIVWTLIQMTPPDAQYLKVTDVELIEDIHYLILHINYPVREQLAEEVWGELSQQLQRIDQQEAAESLFWQSIDPA